MTVDTVLFDLDGTLVEYERPIEEVLGLAFAAADLDPFFTAEEYRARMGETIQRGGFRGFRKRLFAALAQERGEDPVLGVAVATAYERERDHSRVYLLDGALDALDALATDHRLGLVTNGPPQWQRPKLEAAGLTDRFETVVFAGHGVATKPDPAPFRRALCALGSTPNRAVHVGNALPADVAGARAAGCQSVWLPADPAVDPDPVPDYALTGLSELQHPPWRV